MEEKRQRWRSTRAGAGLVGLVISLAAAPLAAAPPNPIIQVGVVQRFGDDPQAQIRLEAPAGERLNLRFETNGQPQTLSTTQVVLGVKAEPITAPDLRERVVLSHHRSFESAEYSAQEWRQRGIEAEIAQPGGWEVWASRQQYHTPLLRRLLVKNLQAQGFSEVHLDSQVVSQVPKLFFQANGYRYHRDRLALSSSGGRTRVVQIAPGAAPPLTRVYAGGLSLQPNAYETYTLINQVPVETYLRGVVPHEIGPRAPRPAIQAQAVLARTYVLRNLRRFAIDGYQICADTQCQVYRGLSGTVPAADQAIQATRGQVLTYQNELVDALYSSTSGGVTAAFSHVWNGPDRPYLKPVVDSVSGAWNLSRNPLDGETSFRAFMALDQGFNEQGWQLFRWRYDSTLAEITQDLRQFLGRRQHPLAGFSQVNQVRVTERAPSGRVQGLEIDTNLGPVRLEKDEIVRVLSAPRSLLFYLDPIYAPAQGDTPPTLSGYRFVGGGWGHGVGLSQTGSYRLGQMGWNYGRILQFYYPGTTLQPIHNGLTLWSDPQAAPTPDP
ncbi:MAG: SpoIID/LytB domain-containing protein [Cyanobacteriota bacterium]|nr:SpoIID/LytB domain-containing protein [Cyanobacteriota bacterium]